MYTSIFCTIHVLHIINLRIESTCIFGNAGIIFFSQDFATREVVIFFARLDISCILTADRKKCPPLMCHPVP